jgi:hypothetical protein
MGDTGSELVGLLLLIFLVFGVIGLVGVSIIGWLETRQVIKTGNSKTNQKPRFPLVQALAFLMVILIASVILAIILRPSPPTYNTGQPVRVGDWVIEVTNFRQPGSVLQTGVIGTPGPNEIKAQGSWLEVEVSIEDAGLGPLVPKRTDFEVADSQNNAYLPNLTASIKAYAESKSSPNSKNGISPDETAKLWLVYDLPVNSSGFELVFKQGPNPRFRLSTATRKIGTEIVAQRGKI